MMKKISILTFWSVPNYGAFAQAYALNHVLRTLYPNVEVEHIAYLHPKHQALYFQRKKPALHSLSQLKNMSYYKQLFLHLVNREIKYPHFSRDWDKIPHIEIESENKLEETQWDIVITGSDAIWEYSIADFGNDIHLIGNNIKCSKLISYASSFGNMNSQDQFPPFIKTGLEKYHAISVRDQSSQKIVTQEMQKSVNCPIVLDPTFLYDFRKDKNIPSYSQDNYILVYGNEFTDSLIEEVRNYASLHNLQIIGAGIAPEWCSFRLINISPTEWIGMFSKASFIVTCTFHGLMLAINYNKKVFFNQIEYTKNRSKWLLDQLGLSALYKKSKSLHGILNYEWDYYSINKKLAELRESSLNFLKEALNDEQC